MGIFEFFFFENGLLAAGWTLPMPGLGSSEPLVMLGKV